MLVLLADYFTTQSSQEKLAAANDILGTELKTKDEAEESLKRKKCKALRKSNEAEESLRELLTLQKMETYRAKGLLSSRGLFEAALMQAAAECDLQGKFNARTTINAIRQNRGRRWPDTLAAAATKCFPGKRVGTTLHGLYSTLSEDIHGQPWNVNAVQLSDQLTPKQKCFMDELCKALFKLAAKKITFVLGLSQLSLRILWASTVHSLR